MFRVDPKTTRAFVIGHEILEKGQAGTHETLRQNIIDSGEVEYLNAELAARELCLRNSACAIGGSDNQVPQDDSPAGRLIWSLANGSFT